MLRARDESGFETLVLTFPGLVALAGVNQAGVGVAVNALGQLRYSSNGPFERLRDEFPRTWIDRAAEKRLAEIGAGGRGGRDRYR